ncbi:hypothetical protein C2I36_10765 [Rhodobacteraceae bacterium WD3A24]|nr:hypothetical protein C2I36_10765 [Rhodobacteraceae bacterium WD3A24]
MAVIVSAMSEDVAGRMVRVAGAQTRATPGRPALGQTDARQKEARAAVFATLIGRSHGDGPAPQHSADGGQEALAAGEGDGAEGLPPALAAPSSPDAGHVSYEAESPGGGAFDSHLRGQDDPSRAAAALAGKSFGIAHAEKADVLPDTPPDGAREASGVPAIAAAAQPGGERAGGGPRGPRGAEGPPVAWPRTDADGAPAHGSALAAPEEADRRNDRTEVRPADQPHGRDAARPEAGAQAALVARLAAPQADESRAASIAHTAPPPAGAPERSAGAAAGAGTGLTAGHAGEPPSEGARAPSQPAGEGLPLEAARLRRRRQPARDLQDAAARGAAVVVHRPSAGATAGASSAPAPGRSSGETMPPAHSRDGRPAGSGRAAPAGPESPSGDRRASADLSPALAGHGNVFGQTGAAGGQGAGGSAPRRPVPEGAREGQPGPAGRAAEAFVTPARGATEPPAPADRPVVVKVTSAPRTAAAPATAGAPPLAPEPGILPWGGGAGPGGAETSGEGVSPAPDPRAPAPPQTPAAPQAAPRADIASNAAPQIGAALTQAEDGPVEVRLSPEELGRVRLFMSGGEGGMNVHLQADRGETLDLLRRHVSMLADELRQAGYDALNFSFSDGREDAPAPQAHAPVTPAEPEADGDAGAGPAPPPRRPGEDAGLDLRL